MLNKILNKVAISLTNYSPLIHMKDQTGSSEHETYSIRFSQQVNYML